MISAGMGPIDRKVWISSRFGDEINVSIASPDPEDLPILSQSIIENLDLIEKIETDTAKEINYSRIFKGKDSYDYGVIFELYDYFKKKWQITKFGREKYTLDWGIELWSYSNIEKFLSAAHRRGVQSMEIYWAGGYLQGYSATLRLDKKSAFVEISGFDENIIKESMDHIKKKLRLEKAKFLIDRSAFIAHRFDRRGREISVTIEKLLESMDFRIVSGEEFSVERVSEKIKNRIRQQSVFVIIHSKPSDDSATSEISQWLVQEATFALAQEKPIFMFVEKGIEPIPGLQGDMEFIRFDMEDLSKALIQFINGIKEYVILPPEYPKYKQKL